MAFLKRFFPYLMRASIRGPTSLAPDERSCHAGLRRQAARQAAEAADALAGEAGVGQGVTRRE
jgi:hypothetical protein